LGSRKHKVRVIATQVGKTAYDVDFRLEGSEVQNNQLIFDKKKLKMKKKDEHEIWFELENKKGADVRFTSNEQNVMWVHKVPDPTYPCPDEPSYLPDEFETVQVKHQTTLQIRNTNMAVEYLAFRLNFVPAGKKDVPIGQYISYDPISGNKDSSYPFLGTKTVIGVALGTAAFALATALFFNR
jgi:hypothetical protein